MKIGSYIVEGMASYGVKTNEGIVDLRKRLGDKYADLLFVLRAFALDEVAAAARGQSADFQETDIQFLPVIPAPVNTYAAGINYMTIFWRRVGTCPKHHRFFLKHSNHSWVMNRILSVLKFPSA